MGGSCATGINPAGIVIRQIANDGVTKGDGLIFSELISIDNRNSFPTPGKKTQLGDDGSHPPMISHKEESRIVGQQKKGLDQCLNKLAEERENVALYFGKPPSYAEVIKNRFYRYAPPSAPIFTNENQQPPSDYFGEPPPSYEDVIINGPFYGGTLPDENQRPAAAILLEVRTSGNACQTTQLPTTLREYIAKGMMTICNGVEDAMGYIADGTVPIAEEVVEIVGEVIVGVVKGVFDHITAGVTQLAEKLKGVTSAQGLLPTTTAITRL